MLNYFIQYICRLSVHTHNMFPALQISSGGSGKPAVWIDSCIHSREWIACATTQFFIYTVSKNEMRQITNFYFFILFPTDTTCQYVNITCIDTIVCICYWPGLSKPGQYSVAFPFLRWGIFLPMGTDDFRKFLTSLIFFFFFYFIIQ